MPITGKFIADFSDFQAAVQKAEVSLKGMETGAGKVSTSLNKMVDSFSGRKIIQEAELMGQTFQLLASKGIALTTSELQRMGTVANEAIAKLKANAEQIPPEIQRIADAAKNAKGETSLLSKTFGDLGTQIKATALGFISAQAIIGAVQTGFRLLTDFVGSSVASFAEAEAASRKLEAALKSQGNATPGLAQQYDALAGKFQQTTVFADELITEMQALLVQVGDVGPQQMEQALTAATDLASGLGIDLRTATMLVGKAFEGETGTLKKYGIVIDEAKLKTEGITAVLDAVQEKFGGQAQSEIETYAGKVKQLANAWDDVQESVGRYIVQQPVLNVALAQGLELLRGHTSSTGELTTATDRQAESWYGADLGVLGFANGLRDGLRIINDVAIGMDHLRLSAEMLSKVKPPATFGVGAPIALAGITNEMRLQQEAAARLAESIKPLSAEHKSLAIALDKVGDSAGVIAAKLKVSELAVKKYLEAIKSGGKAHSQFFEDQAKDVIKSHNDLVKSLQDYQRANIETQFNIERTGLKVSDFGKEIKLGAGVLLEWQRVMTQTIPVVADLGLKVDDFGKKVKISTEWIDAAAEAAKHANTEFERQQQLLGQVASSLNALGDQAGGGLGALLKDIANITDALMKARDAAKQIQAGGLGNIVAGGLAGIQAIGQATGQGSKGSRIAGGAATGAQLGAAIGSVIPILGTFAGMLVGAGVGALVGYVRSLGKGRDAVKEFAKAHGGFDILRDRLGALGEEGEKLWQSLTQGVGNNNPEEAAMAIANVGNALETIPKHLNDMVTAALTGGASLDKSMAPYIESLIRTGQLTQENANLLMGLPAAGVPSFDQVTGAAERLGLNIDSIGQGIKQMGFTELASSVAGDLDILARAGADMEAVLTGSRDKIQKLVDDAQKFGYSLPESIKPFLQKMVESGTLTDLFGDKLEDLEDLHFTKPLEQSVDELVKAMRELVGVIKNEVGGAFDELGKKVVRPKVVPDYGGIQARDYETPMLDPATTAAMASRANSPSSAAPITIVTQTYLEGRQIAQSVTPYLPGAVESYGAS